MIEIFFWCRFSSLCKIFRLIGTPKVWRQHFRGRDKILIWAEPWNLRNFSKIYINIQNNLKIIRRIFKKCIFQLKIFLEFSIFYLSFFRPRFWRRWWRLSPRIPMKFSNFNKSWQIFVICIKILFSAETSRHPQKEKWFFSRIIKKILNFVINLSRKFVVLPRKMIALRIQYKSFNFNWFHTIEHSKDIMREENFCGKNTEGNGKFSNMYMKFSA